MNMIWAQVAFILLFLLCYKLWHGGDVLSELGVTKINLRFFTASLSIATILYLIQYYAVPVWAASFPEQATTVVVTQQRLYAGSSTIERLIAFSLAGISEELVFRGYLQPRYGTVLSSVVFAALHFQYGFSLIMLFVFAGSLLLGLLRERANTTASMVAHAGYNALLQIF